MAKGNKRKRKKGGGHAPPPADPAAICVQVRPLIDDAEASADDEHAAGPKWGQIHQLMLKTPVERSELMRAIANRDPGLLRQLVDRLESPDAAAPPSSPDSPEVVEIDESTRYKAMRAFRKRLKLTRLDAESKLGVGPMTGGKHSDITAILPPREFSDDVWQALVRHGELRDAGRGFYELVE